MRLEEAEGLGPVAGEQDDERPLFEARAENETDMWLVIDDQDACSLIGAR